MADRDLRKENTALREQLELYRFNAQAAAKAMRRAALLIEMVCQDLLDETEPQEAVEVQPELFA